MPSAYPHSPRLRRIDGLRGLALIGMILYHFSWDLSYIGYLAPGQVSETGLRLLARIVAFTFLFLAGFSLFLAHGQGIRWQAFWPRLLKIAVAALLVSATTWWLMPDHFIYFGILHQIVLTSLIGLLFLHTPLSVNITVALVIFLLPFGWSGLSGPGMWWLGLADDARASFDYVPFFPWFAAGLLGLTAARILHRHHGLHRLQGAIRPLPPGRWLQWAGRHSLVIYLVHQPVLLAGLYLCTSVFPPSVVAIRVRMENDCRLACEQEADLIFCERFCHCSFEAMERRGLLLPYMQGRLNPEDQPVAAIRARCVAAAVMQWK